MQIMKPPHCSELTQPLPQSRRSSRAGQEGRRGKETEVLCCIKMAAVAAELEDEDEDGTEAGCAWLVRYSVTFHYGKDGDCPQGAEQSGWDGKGTGNC